MHIPYTPRLSYDKQATHSLRIFVCCRCPGLFCTTSSKGPEGMGFDRMDWGNFKELINTRVTKENGPREKSNGYFGLILPSQKMKFVGIRLIFRGVGLVSRRVYTYIFI